LAVEQGQKPLSIVVAAGQRGDSPQFEAVLEKIRVPRVGVGRPRIRPDRVRADMAEHSGLSKSTVGRIWRRFQLKPHLTDTFKLSTDPLFVPKV
jgi:hypothetical protein